jgi:hypothetical protein
MKLFREGDGARAMEVVCGTIESQGRRLSILESRAGGEAGKAAAHGLCACANCGHQATMRRRSMSDGQLFTAYCDSALGGCGMSTPGCATREAAETIWNRRSGGANAQLPDILGYAVHLLSQFMDDYDTEGEKFAADNLYNRVSGSAQLSRAIADADRSPPADANPEADRG